MLYPTELRAHFGATLQFVHFRLAASQIRATYQEYVLRTLLLAHRNWLKLERSSSVNRLDLGESNRVKSLRNLTKCLEFIHSAEHICQTFTFAFKVFKYEGKERAANLIWIEFFKPNGKHWLETAMKVDVEIVNVGWVVCE